MKKKYFIYNLGGGYETVTEFEFTQEEFEVLKKVFDELNNRFKYGCVPTIHIKEVVRCGECKYREKKYDECKEQTEDCYCLYGERRVEECEP